MGHRQIFNNGQVFDPHNEQSWKHVHPEPPYGHLARGGHPGNSSLVYPVDNMSAEGISNSGSQWNSTPSLNLYPSPNPCFEMSHHQSDPSGPSHDPFVYPSSVGNFSTAPENYLHHASSSSYEPQTFNRFIDVPSNGRGPCKRKSPVVPTICERGSSSRYSDGGTLSDLSVHSEIWQEKQTIDCHHATWDSSAIRPCYGGNDLATGNEPSHRNVRSRCWFESESALARTSLPTAPLNQPYVAPDRGDRPYPVEYMGQSSDAPMREWSHFHGSLAAANGRTMTDATLNNEANNFVIGSNNTGAALEIGAYQNNYVGNRFPGPQNLQGTLVQSARGSRSSNSQRSTPVFNGPSSSSSHWGHSATSDERMQLNMESYPSRHLRHLSTIGWRSNDRSGRTRVSNDGFRSLSDETCFRNRLASEGLMIMDRSAMYGSRGLFDPLSDMRLDVDNMSYEELLALGERIGSVSTGLSEDLISKCLTESIYCSSDQVQDEERCIICLDEYKNLDDVGILETCGHDFHVDCIKKWLSMKNLCPICKSSAIADQMKNP